VPREKKTISCEHCGKEFTQARKDQKYCRAQCRFDHFFEGRDNDKNRQEERIQTLENENASLKKHLGEFEETIDARNGRIKELEAQLQAAKAPKKTGKSKASSGAT
jgi:hypothetical protein